VKLLGPLKHDLKELRLRRGRPSAGALIFPSSAGALWCDHDFGNWRGRAFRRAVITAGLGKLVDAPGRKRPRYEGIRPYDLRHSFASLRLWEGCSIPELAAELGHSPATTLSTYAHVITELKHGEKRDAEAAIRAARAEVFGGRAAHIRPKGEAV
jgi:integrase